MTEVKVRNIRIFIAYDGTNYLGWQIQPKGPTVQGIIQDALSKILGHKVKLKAAGRTDAGVHALYQVAHFLTTSDRPVEVIIPQPLFLSSNIPILQRLVPLTSEILETFPKGTTSTKGRSL